MNQRIKELAEQAGAIEAKNITNIPRALSLNGEEIEKFAELLIQKCVGIADDYVKDCTCEEHVNCKHPRSAIGRKIREHFGVK